MACFNFLTSFFSAAALLSAADNEINSAFYGARFWAMRSTPHFMLPLRFSMNCRVSAGSENVFIAHMPAQTTIIPSSNNRSCLNGQPRTFTWWNRSCKHSYLLTYLLTYSLTHMWWTRSCKHSHSWEHACHSLRCVEIPSTDCFARSICVPRSNCAVLMYSAHWWTSFAAFSRLILFLRRSTVALIDKTSNPVAGV